MIIKKYKSKQNNPIEINFTSCHSYKDPFNDIDLDVIFKEPGGNEIVVPAYWAGQNFWKVRYSSQLLGTHIFLTKCSNIDDYGLNKKSGEIEISEYTGNNQLLKCGPIKISKDKRHFEHMDGTPFFWLGDTWWYALAKRFKWPEDFKLLTQDRLNKGFTVIQIVAGMPPEVEIFDPFGENEAGWPWTKDLKQINPIFFDYADIKIEWLVKKGLVPCIFGAWGYYLSLIGIEKMKKHWRYLIARWGAYPVIWSVAGEARSPDCSHDFSSKSVRKKIMKGLQKNWAEVSRYIKSIDPYKRLITVHPSPGDGSYSSWDIFEDPELFDFDMQQTGHFDKSSFEPGLKALKKSLSSKYVKPVLNGEACYEGIMGMNWQDAQRFLFWTNILSGAAGHTYGAQGIWGFRGDEKFVGLSGSWGDTKWKEAYKLPGSYQLGLGKKFLEQFEWQKFELHSDWIEPHADDKNCFLAYAAGIPGKCRVIYFPGICYLFKNDVTDMSKFQEIKILKIEEDINYISYYFNPRTGDRLVERDVKADKNGEWKISSKTFSSNPSMEDWVLVLEKK
jgi:hypothetical protein